MVKEFDNMDVSRALLTTTSVRFTPGAQDIKGTALEKVIERLFGLGEKDKFSVDELRTNFQELSGYTLDLKEVKSAVSRLEDQGRVVPAGAEKGKTRYSLTEEALENVKDTRNEASDRLENVLENLLNERADVSKYVEPFLYSLTQIFSELGEEYAKELTNDSVKSIDQKIAFKDITKQVSQNYKTVEIDVLQNILERFFEVKDPICDQIKWNMAQNYFVMKAIGFGDNLWQLLEEKFGDSVFYLDTNLLIGALEPEHRFHESVVALAKTCDRLDIDLKVSEVSLRELKRWKQFQKHIFEKIQGVVPSGMADEIDSVIYEKYDKALDSEVESVNVDELFTNFAEPKDKLRASFGIEFIDDSWFIETKNTEGFVRCKKHLKGLKFNKKDLAAEHDALMLLWILWLREAKGRKAWFITADKSLPGAELPCAEESPNESLALLGEAILHWVLPMHAEDNEDIKFAKGFATCIKERLLPQEKIFQPEDFAIFSNIDRSIKELPKKDVKELLQHLKNKIPNLDPSDAQDREKINAEISRFLEKPEREYQKKLKRTEDEIDELKNDLEKERSKRRETSGLARLGLVGFIFLLIEGGLVFLASFFGQGENIYQKIVSWPWWYSAVGTGVWILGGKYIIGKERLKEIGLWRDSND